MPYQEKSGKWRGVVKIDGKRYQRTFPTKAEAKKFEVEEKARLKYTELTHEDMELQIFFSKYLDHSEANFTEGVFKEKKTLVKRVTEVWGREIPIKAVSVDMVASYLEKQAANRSANAANRDRKNLLSMWIWGQKRYDFPFNPIFKTDKFRHEKKPQYTPPQEDVMRLLDEVDKNKKDRVFLDCYLNTGARRSEIFRLQWNDDINFERRQIRLGTRKTKDGTMDYQWLAMNDQLFESLKWQWDNRTFKESPYVFVDDKPGPHYGQPYRSRQKFMKGLCKRAGIKPFGFHALRRYVASILADEHKLSSKRIQRILRHKNVATTERYIQNLHDDMRSDLNLLCHNTPSESTPSRTPEQKKDYPKTDNPL